MVKPCFDLPGRRNIALYRPSKFRSLIEFSYSLSENQPSQGPYLENAAKSKRPFVYDENRLDRCELRLIDNRLDMQSTTSVLQCSGRLYNSTIMFV